MCYHKSKLVNLSITNCPNITKLNCSGNSLANLDFLTDLNSEKLKELNISNNNFSSDLTPLSRLVNLEDLRISNNYFTGSPAPLQNLTKLKRLHISNTDIDSGLEYLKSVE